MRLFKLMNLMLALMFMSTTVIVFSEAVVTINSWYFWGIQLYCLLIFSISGATWILKEEVK